MTLFKVAVSRPRALSLTGWVATTPTLSCPVVSREIQRERVVDREIQWERVINREIQRDRVVNREIQREREAVRQAKNRYLAGLT